MARNIRRKRGRKRKGKIRVEQTARIVEKNDATRVARPDTATYNRRMQAQIPRSNGAVFRIKVKRK